MPTTINEVDLVTISACVRQIVSAYDDANSVIERIKGYRAGDNSTPSRLIAENSLDESVLRIEGAFDQYVADYGERFEEGDSVAVIEIQSATIDLHTGILGVLRDSLCKDRGVENDSNPLAELTAKCKDRTIDAMGQLCRRLEQAGVKASASDHRASITDTLVLQSSNENTAADSPVQLRTWTQEYNSSGDEDNVSGAQDERPHARRHRPASLLGRLKHGYSNQKRNTDDTTQVPVDPLRGESKTSHPSLEGSPLDKGLEFPSRDWTLQPRKRASTKDTLSVSPNTLAAPISFPTFTLNTTERRQSSTAIPHPSPDNNYLGFCEGAWRLWNGDKKAMKRSRNMGSSHVHTNVYYLTCSNSKCAFETHLNIDRIWTQVWRLSEQGIKFRWLFLAKSHVQQKGRIKDEMFAYQCMFCVYLGLLDGEKERTLHYGYKAYLEHIAREHRGKAMSDVVLYKLSCVNDRICGIDEEFDINLYPLHVKDDHTASRTAAGAGQSEESQVDRGARLSDAKSENEPWNAGLSEFHVGDMDFIDRRFSRETSS